MFNGPDQVPDNSPSTKWNDWQDHHLPEKSAEFEYSDKTSDHILTGESQEFHYGRTDLPEKM